MQFLKFNKIHISKFQKILKKIHPHYQWLASLFEGNNLFHPADSTMLVSRLAGMTRVLQAPPTALMPPVIVLFFFFFWLIPLSLPRLSQPVVLLPLPPDECALFPYHLRGADAWQAEKRCIRQGVLSAARKPL